MMNLVTSKRSSVLNHIKLRVHQLFLGLDVLDGKLSTVVISALFFAFKAFSFDQVVCYFHSSCHGSTLNSVILGLELDNFHWRVLYMNW